MRALLRTARGQGLISQSRDVCAMLSDPNEDLGPLRQPMEAQLRALARELITFLATASLTKVREAAKRATTAKVKQAKRQGNQGKKTTEGPAATSRAEAGSNANVDAPPTRSPNQQPQIQVQDKRVPTLSPERGRGVSSPQGADANPDADPQPFRSSSPPIPAIAAALQSTGQLPEFDDDIPDR